MEHLKFKLQISLYFSYFYVYFYINKFYLFIYVYTLIVFMFLTLICSIPKSSTLTQIFCNELSKFNYLILLCHIKFVRKWIIWFFCGIALVCSPDNDQVYIEPCRNIQCDITMWIYKEQCCAFCWLNIAKLLINLICCIYLLSICALLNLKIHLPEDECTVIPTDPTY